MKSNAALAHKVQGLPAPTGNCFEAAGNEVLKLIDRDPIQFRLAHGICVGRGPIEGVRHVHAWLESGGIVIDVANGKTSVFSRREYYERAKIDKKEIRRYLPKEAARLMVETGNYGPWDPIFDNLP